MNPSSPSSTLTWPARLFVFVVLLGLWMLLAGNLNVQELAAGAFVALMMLLLFAQRLSIFNDCRLSWLMPLHILIYLGHFTVALLRANIDLASRILSPSLPIRPEVVRIKTALRSPLGKMLLANTITLTPGTLTVDIDDDELIVHWVYCPPGINQDEITRRIAGSFGPLLAKFVK